MNNESTLYLLRNVPLDSGYEHTIDFKTLSAQSAFFDNLIATEMIPNNDYSYIRETEQINVYANKDDIADCNYLFYNNGDKRYYAFITNKEYVNPDCTAISFVIDVMQTFMFDYTIGECFVEREHQDRFIKDGTLLKPVYSTTAENIDIGDDYQIVNTQKLTGDYTNDNIIWVTANYSDPPTNSASVTSGDIDGKVNNIDVPVITAIYPVALSGRVKAVINNQTYAVAPGAHTSTNYIFNRDASKIISINVSRYAPVPFTYDASNKLLTLDTNVTSQFKIGYIKPDNTSETDWLFQYGIFLMPSKVTVNPQFIEQYDNSYILMKPYYGVIDERLQKDMHKEPKLDIAPYRFTEISYGDDKLKLSLEKFYGTPQIVMRKTHGLDDGHIIFPYGYNFGYSTAFNSDHYISTDTSFLELPVKNDAWNDYYRQHKNALVTGFATQAIGVGTTALLGMATGGLGLVAGISQAVSYGTQIANQVAGMKDIMNQPSQVKPTTGLFVNIAKNNLYVWETIKTIKPTYQQRVFNYFYHYGYSVNDFKTPNIKSRYYFNYIKTVGANITSNIDYNYIDEIKRIFDKGVTIWHYRNSTSWHGVGNYNYENAETSIVEVE